MTSRNFKPALAALPALWLLSVAFAQEAAPQFRQQRGQEPRNAGQRAGETIGGAATADATIASLIIPGNREEIALGRLAEQRSTNAEVQAFARQMVQDHTQFLNQLRRFAGMAAGPAAPEANAPNEQESSRGARRAASVNAPPQGPAEETRPAEVPNAAAEANEAAPRANAEVGAANQGHLDVLHAELMIAQRCLALNQQMLGEKQGLHFDKAYIGSQIPAHVGMLAKLEVLRDFASPELRQVLDQGLTTTQKHLDHALQVIHQIDPTPGVAERHGPAAETKAPRRSK